mgnify:FL=1
MTSKPQFAGERVRLGDICDICSGGTPKRSESAYWSSGDIPWVKISDLSLMHVTKTEEHITKSGLENSSAKMLAPGTILYSIFASIGATAMLDISAATNQAIAGIKLKSNAINNKFLYYWLKSQESVSKHSGRGVAQNNINLTILRNMIVPVYSAPVQESIVGYFEHVESEINQVNLAITKLDILVKSRFVEMFGTTHIPSYPVIPIEDACTAIVDCPHETPKYEGELVHPAIRTSELLGTVITWDSMKYVSEEEYLKRIQRMKPLAGDIVYAREGSYGNAAVLPDGHEFCLGQRTMLFRPNRDVCLANYLLYALTSMDVKRQADELNVGSTVPHVNVRDARRFSIPLPPMNAQQEFSVFVQQVDKLRFESGQDRCFQSPA